FDRDYIRTEKGNSLDITWLKDKDSIDASDLPSPEVLAGEAMGELAEALREMDELMRELGANDEADVSLDLVKEALGFGGMSD
ncbi:MAG: SAM-dependent methyltransferase, partial [Spirochaetales bacterium]|nr:SAM-dependent methyltransferase [Spirochaetales bacterium]